MTAERKAEQTSDVFATCPMCDRRRLLLVEAPDEDGTYYVFPPHRRKRDALSRKQCPHSGAAARYCDLEETT